MLLAELSNHVVDTSANLCLCFHTYQQQQSC